MFKPTLEPAQHPVNGHQVYFPGLKRPGREVDHSVPSSAKVKNDWSYTCTARYMFIGCDSSGTLISIGRMVVSDDTGR
jgi:hypothetical protein